MTPPRRRGPSKARGRAWRAYRLRAHGLKWRRIAEDMGSNSPKALVSATRRWALRHGLPWPEASLDALEQWELDVLRNAGARGG